MPEQITMDELAGLVKQGFDHVDERFGKIEATMATKSDLGKLKMDVLDAMDEKLAKHHGDIVIRRKEAHSFA